MSERDKPILCLDFDGVIHRYSKGWQGGVIYDDVTPGFFEWAQEAAQHFQLVIYSSRSKDPEQITAMQTWLLNQRVVWRKCNKLPDESHQCSYSERFVTFGVGAPKPLHFEFKAEKPPAYLTIDDRAIQFRGDWTVLPPAVLREFKPWNVS